MKKELLLHLVSTLFFLALVTVVKRWLHISIWPFWIGGILGGLLPDIDHLIYVYLLQPQDLTSQRVVYLNKENSYRKALELLSDTRYERRNVILHTVLFTGVFFALMVYVITSSGSLFARGIVTAFFLHLLVDQFYDLMKVESLGTWFKNIPFVLDKDKYVFFWVGEVIIFLVVALFL